MSALLDIELDGRAVQTEIPVAPVSGQKVFIETYGCQMNVSDTELMLGILKQSGYISARRPEDADVIVLNTCAIREHAEERIRGRLGQLRRLKYRRPDLIMGVSGCMAKHVSESLMNDAPLCRSRRGARFVSATTRTHCRSAWRFGSGCAFGPRRILYGYRSLARRGQQCLDHHYARMR